MVDEIAIYAIVENLLTAIARLESGLINTIGVILANIQADRVYRHK